MATSVDPRTIAVHTPLGPDALYPTSFRGHEGLSQLFQFDLALMAENRADVAFDKLIGQKVAFSMVLPDGKTKRYWHGICKSFAQTGRDSTFSMYRMEIVPQLWLLTRRHQSRIFQYLSIPDILKTVLAGLDFKLELQGTFEKRDYCVQYRESDYDFASRLMEEEGIYYYFKHTEGGHQMVVANSPQSHAATPYADKAIYEDVEGGNREDMRVFRWEKSQELRSGKVTLWDHHFELPHKHLEAERPTMETVAVGKITHKLKLPPSDSLELYHYPGAYAQRFDGIDRGGGEQAAELNKIFQDNKRVAAIRMEQEAAQTISIRGVSNCRQFSAGHKFTLERHFNADGPYVLTTVEHNATVGSRSGSDNFSYQNQFSCVPLALPFRPAQTTKKPVISGSQTAVVVGPAGDEIFCDKYGRIKVQFHWDRQGKNDADSSCWIRVATLWAGKAWGIVNVPRIGHEVIVAFEEGDPDRPVVIGSVFNADHMPPDGLPKAKMISGLKSNSTPGSGGYNGLTFDDSKGKELMKFHAQKDLVGTIENNETRTVVAGTQTVTVKQTASLTVQAGHRNVDVTGGNYKVTASDACKMHGVGAGVQIKGEAAGVTIEGSGGPGVKITGVPDIDNVADANFKALAPHFKAEGSTDMGLKSPAVTIEGTSTFDVVSPEIKIGEGNITIHGSKITLSAGGGSIVIDGGGITINGSKITSSSGGMHTITGALVKIN
jgi:type VI secretion system secreted protein VgrG